MQHKAPYITMNFCGLDLLALLSQTLEELRAGSHFRFEHKGRDYIVILADDSQFKGAFDSTK